MADQGIVWDDQGQQSATPQANQSGITWDDQPKQDSTQKPKGWLDHVQEGLSNWWGQVSQNVPGTQGATQAGQGLYNLVRHPIQSAQNYGAQNSQIAKEAEDSFKKGDYGKGVAHAINYLFNGLPGIGSTMDTAQNQYESGHPGAGTGTMLGLGTNLAVGATAPKVLESAATTAQNLGRRIVKNVNNPVEEQALQWAENKDVPMSVGQRAGNLPVQRIEQSMENLPGSSTTAQEFYKGQQQKLADVGQDLTQQVSPVQTNEYGAGQAVQQRLVDRIGRLKNQANKFYDDIRNAAAQNQQSVQTGVQQSPVLGPNGQPITTPVMQTFETPVDLRPVRAALQPVYQDLSNSMPEARRAASPAFKSLSDLMTSQDPMMNAMDFDRSLSAIKSLMRDGKSPYLTSKSQAIAGQIVQNGEQQLNSALGQARSDLPKKLQSARNMVKSYYDTNDILQDLNDEPAALYSNLATGGDRVTDTLKDLKRVAPHETSTVGRTFLQGMLDKATKEGGFQRAAGIAADWNRLGPETKTLLFGKNAPDIDNFVLAAKRLTRDNNPSGTAKLMQALGAYGAAGTALGSLFAGNPAGAATVAAGVGANRLAAELLFSQPQSLMQSVTPLVSARSAAIPAVVNAGANNQPQYPQGIMPPPR